MVQGVVEERSEPQIWDDSGRVSESALRRETLQIMLLSYTWSRAWSGEEYCKAMVTLSWEVCVAA